MRWTLCRSGGAGVLPMAHITTASAKIRKAGPVQLPNPPTISGRPSSPAGMAGAASITSNNNNALSLLSSTSTRRVGSGAGAGQPMAAEERATHARAAFAHYAKVGGSIPAGCVILAVADLGGYKSNPQLDP